MKKLKLTSISIGIILTVGITVYGINYKYSNYQKNKAEQAENQAKQQLENEQKGKATDKVKETVNNRIINMNCNVEYNCTSTTDEYFIINTTIKGKKEISIDCKLKRSGDSVDFDNFDSFKNTLNNYVSEEELVEIRHIAIHDYQDMLYGMASKIATWDNVHLSHNDEDYIVQETTDRFFGGDKAYLVTIDSKWTAKDGHTELKHICLHMEYGKDNKLIDARYGDYDKIDPDKDIKNGVKVSNINETANLSSDGAKSTSKITQENAVEIVKKEKKVDESESSVLAFSDLDKNIGGIKYYYIEVDSKGGHGASSSYYVNSQTGEITK